jgi:hypothetical protein
MSGYDDFCTSLQQLLDAGQKGEPLDLEAVQSIAKHARTIGSELEPEQRRHVAECVGKLGDIVRTGMQQVERDLAGLGERRVGIRGYGQLKSTHTGQRLRRRA